MSSERWFNLADFSEGLAIARSRYPEPPGRLKPKIAPKPPLEVVLPQKESAAPTPLKIVPASTADVSKPLHPGMLRPAQLRSELRKLTPETDLAKSSAAKFAMRVDGGSARFTTMWRVRIKR